MEKTLYPKTTRIWNDKIKITEKLDGSCLWIFKLNWELIIAQRNHIFKQSELTSTNSYKGLIGWLDSFAETIDLNEGSWVFWEWIGMGQIWYWEVLDKKFYIFAKANINEEMEVRNINYKQELFIYPFIEQKIPDCIWVVPFIEEVYWVSIAYLDELYDKYCEKVNRKVEGFILNDNNNILKYVRYKNGILTSHKTND